MMRPTQPVKQHFYFSASASMISVRAPSLYVNGVLDGLNATGGSGVIALNGQRTEDVWYVDPHNSCINLRFDLGYSSGAG